MKGKFYQACYTRLDTGEGWRTVNCSSDIPHQMLSVFEKTGVGNAAKNRTPKDRNGKDLNALEVISEQGYVGLSRTQYGVKKDDFGRDVHFSNAYLYEDAYEFLKDPNNLLRIADSNFKKNIEETKVIPTKLEMKETFDVESAFKSCNMTKESYVKYVQCLYKALSTSTKNTIYVLTDGDDETARNLLYLTYSAIPYSLRTRVTAYTCPDIEGREKMLIFCREVPEYGEFVNPQTGENNILTSAIEKRWERNPFVSYFAVNWQDEERNEALFRAMEQWLAEMGDVTMNSMEALRLAFTMCSLDVQSASDDEIAGLLYDWMALPVPNSEPLERNIVLLLNEAVERRIKLGQEADQLLSGRLKTAVTKEFSEANLRYLSFALTLMQCQEVYAYLGNLGKESSVFRKLRELLKASRDGRTLLTGFYFENLNRVVENENASYEDLVEMYYDCEDLEEIIEEVQETLHKKILKLASAELSRTEDLQTVMEHFEKTERDINRVWEEPKSLYEQYHHLIMEKFEPKNISVYDKFYTKVFRDDVMGRFLKALHHLEEKNYEAVEGFLSSDWAEGLNDHLVDVLLKYAIKYGADKECRSMSFWEKFAQKKHMLLPELLLKKKIIVFCDGDEFENSLENDSFWKDTSSIEKFQEECLCCLDKGGSKEILSECCDALKGKLKERKAKEKRREKEMARAAKEEAKMAKTKAKQKKQPEPIEEEEKDTKNRHRKEPPKRESRISDADKESPWNDEDVKVIDLDDDKFGNDGQSDLSRMPKEVSKGFLGGLFGRFKK